MFVPPSRKKEGFRDLFARMTLKEDISSLPPEICTQQNYNRWLIGNLIFVAGLALIGLLYYLL